MTQKIKINRAPVLTLWAAVVAEQLGHPADTALTLGKVLAGLNAQSKGQRLGIYEPSEQKSAKDEAETRVTKQRQPTIRLLGRQIPVQETDDGMRAEEKGKPVDPQSVEKYLNQKFKDQLDDVRKAMQSLAGSLDPETLERRAYTLYEEFRPEIPEGKRGWGSPGELDLEKIRRLAGKS